MYVLNSSVLVLTMDVINRRSAASCSMRAFCGVGVAAGIPVCGIGHHLLRQGADQLGYLVGVREVGPVGVIEGGDDTRQWLQLRF